MKFAFKLVLFEIIVFAYFLVDKISYLSIEEIVYAILHYPILIVFAILIPITPILIIPMIIFTEEPKIDPKKALEAGLANSSFSKYHSVDDLKKQVIKSIDEEDGFNKKKNSQKNNATQNLTSGRKLQKK